MTLRAMYVAPLVAIGAAFTAAGFADQLITPYEEPVAVQPAMAPVAANGETIVTDGETVVTTNEPMRPVVAPAPIRTESTTIYGQRRSEDEFITDDVVKALAAEPRLSGKVGVETYRRVVTLTGRVSTQGQVDRITRVAQRAVDRDVEIHNQVISKV
ncbi:MAG TPA: BON domain-containing protein [Usitatibacter sp.]|nr:BON domain-containing protein [Usitatibacter sp.]